MIGEFKVGDKVMLDPDYWDEDYLNRFGYIDVFNVVYTIEEVDTYEVKFSGGSWHRKAYIKYAERKNSIGGALNNTQSMVSKVEEKIKGGK